MPTDSPKNSTQQTLLIVLGSLIIILGISSLILFFQNRLLRQQIANYQGSPSPTPAPEALADPTANWKEYRDEEYNFYLKYPPEWNEKKIELSDSLKSTKLTPDPTEYQQSQGVTIAILTNSKELSSREYVDQVVIPFQEGSVCNDFKINERIPDSFKGLDTTIVEGLCGVFNQGPRTVIAKDNYLIVISSGFEEQKNDLVYQILSTFRFTDTETTDTSNWEIYKDNDVAFEISYPAGWTLRKTYGKSVSNTGNGRVSGVDISTDLTFGSTVVANVIDSKGSNLIDWIRLNSGLTNPPNETNYMYNNRPAVLIERQREGRPNEKLIFYQDRSYIVFLAVNSSLADLNTADEIISTFKFTN